MKQQNEWTKDGIPTGGEVSQILKLNDDQLRAAVRAVAEAAGMSERRANAVTRDADAIRRKLSSVRTEDLQKLLSQISPEQMAELSAQLQKLKNKTE